MIVAGVMSGTSADGINVALVRIDSVGEPPIGRSPRGQNASSLSLIAHAEYPFPAPVRRAVLAMMNAESARVSDLARLNFLLGELYADAVKRTTRQQRVKLDLIGCHGQTLYHQGRAERYLGHKLAVTWQTGEGAVLAARLGVPVVSDFRTADMAVGGKGAPLVPFLDYSLYRDPRIGRIAQNIGGIANLTAIPAGASLRQLIAFDTGPGNMVLDALMQQLYDKPYDRDGRVAASGQTLEPVLARLLRESFFQQKPPRTAGREEFGREYVAQFLALCRGASKPDIVATATALTARSVAGAVQRFVLPKFARARTPDHEMIVSGGGAKNSALIRLLRDQVARLAITLHFSDDFGLPAEAKEAVAFALLAHETWHRRPSNVPSATGASRPAILGKISYA